MDIVFQSGEFYNTENNLWTIVGLIVNFLGIVAGALVAIYVFKLAKSAEEKKENQRLLELEQYIRLAIANLSTPITQQLDALKDFYKELSKRNNVHHAPQEIITFHTKTMSWISHEDFHKIFVQLKTGDLVQKSELIRELNLHDETAPVVQLQ